MQLLSPLNFEDYELIDCGDFEKLERFGKYVTIRPEPQAVWRRMKSESEWEKLAHVKFIPRSSSAGEWKKLKR
jgi:23S rRNA (cytosine1962-C5)-methyltransferase